MHLFLGLFPGRKKSIERELAQVSVWRGRWRAGAGARTAAFTKGLRVERHPRGGKRHWEQNWVGRSQRNHLRGRAFGKLGPPAVK